MSVISIVCTLSTDSNSPQSSSPCSSSPNSPIPQSRPSSLHVLGSKIGLRYSKSGRCKSTNSIPPSPLACNPPHSLCLHSVLHLPLPEFPKASTRFIIRWCPRRPSWDRRCVPAAQNHLVHHCWTGFIHLRGSPVPNMETKRPSPLEDTLWKFPQGEDEGLESQASDIASGLCVSGTMLDMGCTWLANERGTLVVCYEEAKLVWETRFFKKQEAVQEVSFDDSDDKEVTTSTPVPSHPRFKAAWISTHRRREALRLQRGKPTSLDPN